MSAERYTAADMLVTIQENVNATQRFLGKNTLEPRVLHAIANVPRDRFVPLSHQKLSYGNFPLPIGHGQTISQPYMVAIMTDLLEISPTDRVLEIGTGCGYQTAILAQLAAQVYSIEIIPELSVGAASVLSELGYKNIQLRCADGYHGWPEAASFDGIIITAACPQIPPALITQLKIGARLVLPIGHPQQAQTLTVARRLAGENQIEIKSVLSVSFVPMTDSNGNVRR